MEHSRRVRTARRWLYNRLLTRLFSSGLAPEEVKGKPKSIRVERRDLTSPVDRPYLQELTHYQSDGKKTERSTYRPDGTLSYREVYEYGAKGRLTLTTFDDTGRKVQEIRRVRSAQTRTEEEVVMNAAGRELSRTVSKPDAAGRVLESTLTDLSDNSQIHQMTRYDAEDRLLGSEVTFPSNHPGLPSRMEVNRSGDVLVMTSYAADGTILTRSEAREDNASRESSLMFNGNAATQVTTIEQIDSRDAEGNWTKKTIFERRGPTGPMEPVAEICRTIIY